MQTEQRVHALGRGGRLTKWKGKVASVAPSLLFLSTSVLAISAGSVVLGEVVNVAQSTPLISAVNEDHTITASGAINVNPLLGPGVVEINVADYSGTLTNAGQLSSPEGNLRTRSAVDLNGDLSGVVLNSGAISMSAAIGDSADLRGVDVSGNVTGLVQNTGTIRVANSALTFGTAIGISASDIDGEVSNSGTIELMVDTSSSAKARGIRATTVGGAVRNTGTITIQMSANGSATVGDAFQLGAVTGTVENTGSIQVVGTNGQTVNTNGIEVSDLTGTLINSGGISIGANAVNTAVGNGIEVSTIFGRFENSGDITITTAGNSGDAYFDIIETNNVSGSVLNTGQLTGFAIASSASVDGIDAGDVLASGTYENAGLIRIQAVGTSSAARADALDFSQIDGR
ncbi:hypothetical protein [Ruegeria sp. EL01]|uniref:hypothetical protein n=1 Tax=Ruegeria sp. EL01 TaxID=2107578 RepID=UPI000EA82168|nr:hypothetical protein [Ruegeria sp. EL01]